MRTLKGCWDLSGVSTSHALSRADMARDTGMVMRQHEVRSPNLVPLDIQMRGPTIGVRSKSPLEVPTRSLKPQVFALGPLTGGLFP